MLLQSSVFTLWALTGWLLLPHAETRESARADRASHWVAHERTIKLNDKTLECTVFSPDGKYIAAGGERFVHIYETTTGKEVHRLAGHSEQIDRVSFSPDGTTLASAGHDKTIRLWDIQTGKPVKTLIGHPDPISGLAFVRDSQTIASCSPSEGHRNYIMLWDIQQGAWDYQIRKRRPSHFLNLTISPNNRLLAVAERGGVVAVYDVEDFGLRGRIALRERFELTHSEERTARFVSFSADATRLVSCGDEPILRIWDARRGRLLQTIRRPDNHAPVAAVFTRDGSQVISVTVNGTLELWNCSDGTLSAAITSPVKDTEIQGLAISTNGNLLATCGNKGHIDIWRLPAKIAEDSSHPTHSQKVR